VKIRSITAGSSIAAMIFSLQPQNSEGRRGSPAAAAFLCAAKESQQRKAQFISLR
jgi:hypothetical protein